MSYPFDGLWAIDPLNPSNVAQNAEITIHAVGDSSKTPLDLTDAGGVPVPNPVFTNEDGFAGAFRAAVPRVAWSGGNATGSITSWDGLKEDVESSAQAAQDAVGAAESAGANAVQQVEGELASYRDAVATSATDATTAAQAATAAAGLVDAPAGEAVKAAISAGGAAEGSLKSVIGGWDGNFSEPFTSLGDASTGEGFIAKSATLNTKQGVIGWQHASDYGYLLHFEAREGGAAPGAMIGIGLDKKAPDGGLGVAGILISNKVGSQGIVLSNGSQNDNPNGFGLYGAQDSTIAPMMALHQRVSGAAPLMEFKVSGGTPTAGQVLTRFVVAGNHLSGDVNAKTGTLRWLDLVSFRDTQVNTVLSVLNRTGTGIPARLQITDNASNAALLEARVNTDNKSDGAYSIYRSTGGGTNWAFRFAALSRVGHLQASPIAAKDSENWKSVISFTDAGLGFFGAPTVGQQTIKGAATDATTAQELVNDLRAKLVSLGLIKA